MAARRRSKRLGGVAARAARAATETKGDFFPPGYEGPELPPVKDSELVTYFLQTDKKGLAFYIEHAIRYHQDGFRAVMVGPPTFVFDRPSARLVGRVQGDHFLRAVEWAKSNIIKEVHAKYKLAGGGTPAEREASLKRYSKARAALAAHDAKRKALEDAIDEASLALLQRFGKGPLQIEGATYDPSYVRDKVFWKKRMGTP